MDKQKIDECIQTLSEFLDCINDFYHLSDDSYLDDENANYLDGVSEEDWDIEDDYEQRFLDENVSNLNRIINELENYFTDLSSHKELHKIKKDLEFGDISEEKLNVLFDIHQKLIENLQSQVPDKLMEYFYFKCLLADFQNAIPEDIYNNLMDEILELNDSSKINILETTPSLNVKFEIINSLRDENIKLNYFNELPDSDKLGIALTFQDDENKLKALKLITENKEKLELTLSLDDDYKIKALNNFERNEIDSKGIVEICSSFSDKTKIMDAFTALDICDERTKFNIISSIDDSETEKNLKLNL